MTSTLDNFVVSRTLGSGFSAKVKLAQAADGTEYALKIFDFNNPAFNSQQFMLLKREVEATTSFDHKHVVKYYTFKEEAQWKKQSGDKKVAYIVQELISGGELFDYVSHTGPFSEKVCRYYFKQMLQGLHYIHSKGFSHRDLKPENILLDKNYDVKIVDFGFACPLEGRDGSGYNTTLIGTPGYMCPEILKRQAYQGQVADLFALGVILFILYSGHPPFEQASDNDTYYKLIATNRSDLFWRGHSSRKAEGFYSQEFKDLITCMLQLHPHQRLSIADIIGHQWMKGDISTQQEIQDEFTKRHEVNKQKAQEEAEKKAAMSQTVSGRNRRNVEINGRTYLSAGAVADQTASVDENAIRLTMKEYNAALGKTTAFFTTFPPEEIWSMIDEKLRVKGIAFEPSDKTWKLQYDISRGIVTGSEANTSAAEEESKQSEVSVNEKARVQIELLKVADTGKICIEFKRKAGSTVLFHSNVKELMDNLSLVYNTTL